MLSKTVSQIFDICFHFCFREIFNLKIYFFQKNCYSSFLKPKFTQKETIYQKSETRFLRGGTKQQNKTNLKKIGLQMPEMKSAEVEISKTEIFTQNGLSRDYVEVKLNVLLLKMFIHTQCLRTVNTRKRCYRNAPTVLQ